MAKCVDIEPLINWLEKRARDCNNSRYEYSRNKGKAFTEVLSAIQTLPLINENDAERVEQEVIRPLCNRCAALTHRATCLFCGSAVREYCERLSPVFNENKGGEDDVT